MDTSNCTEYPKKEGDAARWKEVKEEETGSRNSSTDSINSGSGPYYQIYTLLGWASW
jgi:hypothetical protein